ncbi:MAG: glycoside hydrolase family 88 protein [Erysipelotrichaceae bacterium]|nr:glycoside hydrolase family 88 protein [Erysipelotrichaceae bacterium]
MEARIDQYIDKYLGYFQPYKKGVWCYEDGILMTAIFDMYKVTGDKKYFDFVYNFYDSMIEEDGVIKNYEPTKYSIDDVCPGIGLMKLYRDCPKEKFKKALDEMYGQMLHHPRTKEGSFWHKQIYPNQVWMDGIYMGVLYIAMYAKEFDIQETKEDVDHQLHTLVKRLYDEDRKLFVHAYDEAKVMQWADKETGRSPNVWARACGWVMMAVVDIYEELGLDICKDILVKEIEGLKPYLEDGMLYQIVDVRREHNYLETSGSVMMAYAIFKGKRLGMIEDDKLGHEVFDTVLKKQFDGRNLYNICQVGGLDNYKRDGSFEYYMSENISANEVKGVAPFIMAYSEVY